MDSLANYTSYLDLCVSLKMMYIFMPHFMTCVLLFPMFTFVLYTGYKNWKKSSSTTGNLSHSDVFTFHMIAVETISLLGSCVYLVGLSQHNSGLVMAAVVLKRLSTIGGLLLHDLTCMERYLAVVQPITYLRLRRRGGVRIRNTCIRGVWIFSSVYTGVLIVLNWWEFELISGFVLSFLSLAVVSFCSVSVLCVLIRPGPGEGGGDRKRIDQSKLAAFYTMMAILGALLMRFISLVAYHAVNLSAPSKKCVVLMTTFYFDIPSSLVLPLLFLHRAGKLPGCTARQ